VVAGLLFLSGTWLGAVGPLWTALAGSVIRPVTSYDAPIARVCSDLLRTPRLPAPAPAW
jgi:hypothetical protein